MGKVGCGRSWVDPSFELVDLDLNDQERISFIEELF